MLDGLSRAIEPPKICQWAWASSGTVTDSEHEGLTAPGSESVYLANMLNYI